MKTLITFAAAYFIAASPLAAQDAVEVPEAYTAETMLYLCRGDVSDVDPQDQSMTCTFRLQGVGDMMLYNCISREGDYDPAPELTANISGSRGAIRQTFINFMEDHPEHWGEHWSWAVALAFSDKFPCES